MLSDFMPVFSDITAIDFCLIFFKSGICSAVRSLDNHLEIRIYKHEP